MTTSVNSDTVEYFFTPALKGLAQQLVHLAFFGDGLSVVAGPHGSGKTALATEILGHLGQAHDITFVSFTAELELADCLERVSESLGISCSTSQSVGEMLAELRHYVQALAQEKKLVVVVIDDAHFMEDQAIGALVSLVQGSFESNVGLHLILFSEPGLDSRIDALQILDVAVYDFTIPNFSPSELASFLTKYSEADEPLASSEIQKAWASSRGFPGPALDFIDNSGEDIQSESDGLKIPFAHIAAITILGVILIWSLFLRDAEPTKVSSIAVNNEQSPLPLSNDQELELLEKDSRLAQSKAVISGDTNEDKLQTFEPSPESDIGNEVQVFSGTDGRNVVNIESLSSDVISANAAETPAIIAPEVEPSAVPHPLVSPVTRVTKSELSDSEAFLMQQSSEYYVLQVIAASNKSSLDAYLARQVNKDSLRMYRGTREGKSWFVIVQGVYRTRDLALNARKTLPSEQANAGPWPRKLSSIKEEIESFRLK